MIRIDVSGQLNTTQRLALLKMTKAKRKKLLKQTGKKVRSNARKRLREQKGLDGKKWEKRKSPSRKKMLRGLSKRLVVKSNPNHAVVTFDHVKTGGIAKAHQDGHDETFTKSKAKRRDRDLSYYDDPATKKQARALKEAGFKIRRKNGKGWKKATMKWITDNMTIGHAGLVLKTLRNEESKDSWVISLPARSFLGATESEIKEMSQTIFDQTIGA